MSKPTLVSARIALIIFTNPLKELLRPSLLEQTHQGRPESFTSIRRDLGHGSFGAATLLNIAPRNLSELEVSGDVGGNEDIGQVAVRHKQLGNEIDVPAVGAAVFLPWLLALFYVSIHLEELCCVSRRRIEEDGDANLFDVD